MDNFDFKFIYCFPNTQININEKPVFKKFSNEEMNVEIDDIFKEIKKEDLK